MSYTHNPTAHTASVFGPAAMPIVWTNLSLATVTGSQTVLAVLKVEVSGGINARIAVRPGGDADEYFAGGPGPHGATRCFPVTAGVESSLLIVKTSAAGVIQWNASAASTAQIWVLGYCSITDLSTNVVADSTFPTSWAEVDLGAIVGYKRVLAGLKFHRTGGSAETFALRPSDDADNFLVTLPEVAGPNQDGNAATSVYSMMLTSTDEDGKFDYQADAGPPAGVLDMAAYTPIAAPTAGEEQVFAAAAPPVAWTALDLTVSTGPGGATGMTAARNLVVIKAHHDANPGLVRLAIRGADDAGDYESTNVQQMKGCACCELEDDQTTIMVCETDATGRIDWIASAAGNPIDLELVGFVAPPAALSVSNQSPVGVTTDEDEIIGATITSVDDPIDLTSIELTATDARSRTTAIITAGVIQSPFTGLIAGTAPGDREVVIACQGLENLGNGEFHTFSLSAESTGGGAL